MAKVAVVKKTYYKFIRKMKASENLHPEIDLETINSFVGKIGELLEFSKSSSVVIKETHLAILFRTLYSNNKKKTTEFYTVWYKIAKRCLRKATKREIHETNSSKPT